MKPVILLVAMGLVLPGLVRPRATEPPSAAPAGEWEEVFHHEFDEHRVDPPDGSGGMGTSGKPITVDELEGYVLIDRRFGGQLTLFVGWLACCPDVPDGSKYLRAVFHGVEGTRHVTPLYAGSFTAMQFCSPFEVPARSLSHVTIERDRSAPWR